MKHVMITVKNVKYSTLTCSLTASCGSPQQLIQRS